MKEVFVRGCVELIVLWLVDVLSSRAMSISFRKSHFWVAILITTLSTRL
jgi:hypothetical protein